MLTEPIILTLTERVLLSQLAKTFLADVNRHKEAVVKEGTSTEDAVQLSLDTLNSVIAKLNI